MSRETQDRPTPRFFRRECSVCGHAWIGASTCPSCGAMAKSGQPSEEFTKKIMDPPDLLKKGS
jgi:rubrerythrin